MGMGHTLSAACPSVLPQPGGCMWQRVSLPASVTFVDNGSLEKKHKNPGEAFPLLEKDGVGTLAARCWWMC